MSTFAQRAAARKQAQQEQTTSPRLLRELVAFGVAVGTSVGLTLVGAPTWLAAVPFALLVVYAVTHARYD